MNATLCNFVLLLIALLPKPQNFARTNAVSIYCCYQVWASVFSKHGLDILLLCLLSINLQAIQTAMPTLGLPWMCQEA